MKRILSFLSTILIFGLIALVVMFIPNEDGEYIWNPFDYARITEVDYKAVVVDEEGSDGKVIITERLTFDIHAMLESNTFWELWRDLPEAYVDGVKVDYTVNSVKQIYDDGSELIYQESPRLYWDDYDYINTAGGYGPGKWYHSEGPYMESLRQYECVFFYIDGIYRDTVTFEIEYEMVNAALRYNDSSELYLSMYSEDTIKHLTSFKGEILIPNEKMPSVGNYYANTYGTNDHSFPFVESDDINPGYHTFAFELDQTQLNFKSYNQYIEFALVAYGDDRHKFTQHASINSYYYYDVLDELQEEQAEYDAIPGEWNKVKITTFVLCLGTTGLLLGYAYFIIKRIKTKHSFYQSEMDIEYFRDIPSDLDPSFASELVFCKHRISDNINDKYSATMLSLVHKGYISLEQIKPNNNWKFNNIKIVINYNPTSATNIEQSQFIKQPTQDVESQQINSNQEENVMSLKPLTPTEEQFFNLICRHAKGVEITLRFFQQKVSSDYQYTNTFVKNIKAAMTRIGVSQGYYQKADYKKPQKQVKGWAKTLSILGILVMTVGNFISYRTRLDLAFGSFFILGIGCIISAIYLFIASKKLILLTQFGEDEYAKWRGLYKFLNSETLMHEKTAIDIVLWEQYLIYATAFGISKKVLKALKVRAPHVDTSPMLRHPYYRSRGFYISSRAFRTATRSASFTSRTGGHGGYGGGGRGGGGGGGGH